MTDRELLEQAAKAAGYTDIEFVGDGAESLSVYEGDNCIYWNPLYNDGDALRLAVKLQIDLVIFNVWAKAKYDAIKWIMVDAITAGSVEAATRRAIVRVAAEIGRAMP